ncbi:Hypothetical protein HVR_LOCUS340 [uncultured virus]|nr:Hypothetical protein HVR_LOCUS340 [uncultured virus]
MKEHLQRDDVEARKDLYGVIPMSYIDDIIDYNHPYFHMYVNVMLRKHLGLMNYENQLMTLLKSQGIRFGGVINSENETENILYKEISRNYKEEKKRVKHQNYIDIANSRTITYEEVKEISENEKATKVDKDVLKKHYLITRYELETIIPEFIEANMYRTQQHRNVSTCAELSVECEEQEKFRIMTDVQSKMFNGEGDGTTHITERMKNTEKMLNYKRCMYLINKLRLLRIPNFLKGGIITRNDLQRNYNMIERHYEVLDVKSFKDIIKLFNIHFGIEILDLDIERRKTPIINSLDFNNPMLNYNNKYLVTNYYRRAEDRNLYVPIDMKGSRLKPIKYIPMGDITQRLK